MESSVCGKNSAKLQTGTGIESFISCRSTARRCVRAADVAYTLPNSLEKRLLRWCSRLRRINRIAAKAGDGEIVEYVRGQHEMFRQIPVFRCEVETVHRVEIDESIA